MRLEVMRDDDELVVEVVVEPAVEQRVDGRGALGQELQEHVDELEVRAVRAGRAQLRRERERVPRRPAEREDDDDRDEDLGRLMHAVRAGQRDEQAALSQARPDGVVEAAGEGQGKAELEDEGEDRVDLASCVVRPFLYAVCSRYAQLCVEDNVLRRVHGDRCGDSDREKDAEQQ